MKHSQAIPLLLAVAVAGGVFGAPLVALAWASAAPAEAALAQVVITPRAEPIGPARNWTGVDPAYRYYYGPNYQYDRAWYAQRHLAHPNDYVAYAYDPADVCSTEYYYMPDDGVYDCYQPDPVAQNSALQSGCPGQPYLYICPNDQR